MISALSDPSSEIVALSEGSDFEAVSVLARAFRDNPLNSSVIRSSDPERRLRCNLASMRLLLPSARAHGHLSAAISQGRVAAVLVASPPFAYPLQAPGLAARLRCTVIQGMGVARRWGQVFRALDAVHPREPHWYLGTLGVRVDCQGEGVGTGLLSAWLERVDRDGLPAYLETDRFENVSFYGGMGFEVAERMQVLETPIWRMDRAARSPAAD